MLKQFDTNYRKQTIRFIFRQLAKDRLRRGTDPGYGYDFSELQDPDQAQIQIKSIKTQMKTLYILKTASLKQYFLHISSYFDQNKGKDT